MKSQAITPSKAKAQSRQAELAKERDDAIEEITKYLKDIGGMTTNSARRSAEAAVGREITSVAHLQRMLKVVNFSLESIHMTKAQADKIIASLKPSSPAPGPRSPAPAPASGGKGGRHN